MFSTELLCNGRRASLIYIRDSFNSSTIRIAIRMNVSWSSVDPEGSRRVHQVTGSFRAVIAIVLGLYYKALVCEYLPPGRVCKARLQEWRQFSWFLSSI